MSKFSLALLISAGLIALTAWKPPHQPSAAGSETEYPPLLSAPADAFYGFGFEQNLLLDVERMRLETFGAGDPAAPFEPVPPQKSWARQALDSLSLEEKIAQLIMLPAYSNQDAAHVASIENLIRKYKIGGLIFMQGGPGRQISLANRYQKLSKIPLLISQDAEWGINMRLDSTVRFPRNMTLGAVQDSMLLYELGVEMGRQCRRVGVHINFAPVVDVNNNAANPVINDRSFGENKYTVARNGILLMKGMEHSGVIACAKHFPGHGDTGTDSHLDLPVINHSVARLDSVELYPFRRMIQAGVPSVMIAHLFIPALDPTPNRASTLSPAIVDTLLRQKMGFQGLIITDALSMQGVTKFFKPGEVDLLAFKAGNDILLFSGDVQAAITQIKGAIERGEVSREELDRRVLKVLSAKEWLGLQRSATVPQITSRDEVGGPKAEALSKKLYEAAITLVKNENQLVPLKGLENRSIACVEIGSGKSSFHTTLSKYTSVASFTLPAAADRASVDRLLLSLRNYNTVIVGVDGMSRKLSDGFGVSAMTRELMKSLNASGKDVIVTLFGSPYGLKHFGEEKAVLVAYENVTYAKVAAAEAIFGGIKISGKLPVTASPQFTEGISLLTSSANRPSFGSPEEMGMDGRVLDGIDSIAKYAIEVGATPGCVVMVMRGSRVVFEKGFGRTEYNGGVPVDPQAVIYDLASVTKVCATTMATMRLAGEGKLDVEAPVSKYLSEFASNGKGHIKVRNLLSHNAGFRSWIPFYAEKHDSEYLKMIGGHLYQPRDSGAFCTPVAQGMFMCMDYKDTMWTKIVRSDLRNEGKVLYSDLSMIVMQRVIEKITGTTLDQYVDSVFYQPLGMDQTMFNPAIRDPGQLCAPTEMDNYWRMKKVQGYVHDQTSAMFGGVSGHAGLFSNIYDLAKLCVLLRSGGTVAGEPLVKQEVLSQFTSKQMNNSRRGLGWDKPEMTPGVASPCSRYASASTFGHTGFTGICLWIDPEYDLTFVFLSNRTFPSMENKKLISEDIRNKMQDLAYESILSYQMAHRYTGRR